MAGCLWRSPSWRQSSARITSPSSEIVTTSSLSCAEMKPGCTGRQAPRALSPVARVQNLASVHVPYYIDGQFTDDFHGRRVIDGSIYLPTLSEPETLARPPYHLPDGSPPELLICHADDPRMRERYPSPVDFLKAGLPPAALEEMIGWGAAYMETLNVRPHCCAAAAPPLANPWWCCARRPPAPSNPSRMPAWQGAALPFSFGMS